MLSIDVSNQQDKLTCDQQRMRHAVEVILGDAEIAAGAVSIAIVDDATIHDLNRRYLAHDYPTDVLSFVLEREDDRLEGEVVASADTAAREAPRFGWSADEELLLYVIHGTLHLVGFDDTTDELRSAMRAAETRYLAACGVERAQAPDARHSADA